MINKLSSQPSVYRKFTPPTRAAAPHEVRDQFTPSSAPPAEPPRSFLKKVGLALGGAVAGAATMGLLVGLPVSIFNTFSEMANLAAGGYLMTGVANGVVLGAAAFGAVVGAIAFLTERPEQPAPPPPKLPLSLPSPTDFLIATNPQRG